jgi:putative aldouronate transport system permease protein
MRQQANYRLAKRGSMIRYINDHKYLYLLLLPCVVFLFIFNYVPMYGLIIAFKDFNFAKGIMGSSWVGFDNFKYLFSLDDFYQVFVNSVTLSFMRIAFTFPIPIILALMLNEIRSLRYKKLMQTTIYLPYFISWIVIGGILINMLSPSWGFVNELIKNLGYKPVFFLGDDRYFRGVALLSTVWKQSGWDTIIYLTAITSVNPDLFEAAMIDGAGKFRRIWNVTLPCIRSTIVILLLLSIGNVMNNGFEQIYVLQNPGNLTVAEVFETYTYKLGMVNGRFSFATAVGFFSSSVGLLLLLSANKFAKVIGEDGIF